MSRRQLHEAERGKARDAAVERPSVRSCGMEALDAAQHRTKVKLRKAGWVWVSIPTNVTPDIQSWPTGSGDGGGVKLCVLTQGDLYGSALRGRSEGGNDDRPTLVEKSDHPIRAVRPGNSGGAKGVTK